MSPRVAAAADETAPARGLFGLFVLAALVNLGANVLVDASGSTVLLIWLSRLSKPVLIPALAGLFAVRARGRTVSIHRGWLYPALLFCWVGDVALMFPGGFLLGMGGFALAHVCFGVSYTRGLSPSALLRPDSLLFVLPLLAYGYAIYLTVYVSLPAQLAGLALPLAGYMFVLLADGATCLFRALQRMPGSAHVLLGAVLFIVSDSIIALSRFVKVLPQDGFVVMLTYILGVYWMVQGSLRDT